MVYTRLNMLARIGALYMAEEPEGVAGAGVPETPKPTPPPQSQGDRGDEDGEDDDKGRGSKSAVLADLATERDKRQAAESKAQEAETQLQKVLSVLGIGNGDDDTVDADKLTAQISEKESSIDALRIENSVLRIASKAGASDPDDLLDSKRFTDSLKGIDASDADAVTAHVEAFIEANPRYAVDRQRVPGVRDAAWSKRDGTPDPAANAAPGAPRMAAALDAEMAKPRRK